MAGWEYTTGGELKRRISREDGRAWMCRPLVHKIWEITLREWSWRGASRSTPPNAPLDLVTLAHSPKIVWSESHPFNQVHPLSNYGLGISDLFVNNDGVSFLTSVIALKKAGSYLLA